MSSEIKPGHICIHRQLRIAVLVVDLDGSRFAACRKLDESILNSETDNRFWPEVDQLVTIEQFCQEWSDFMTFTASVMSISPPDEPTNRGLVWRFWYLGRQAKLHLMKWNVRQQLE